MSLLKETECILKENGKSISDVRWIGTSNSVFEGDIQSILDVDYESNDYLIASEFTVSDDLIVVGDDWWIERHIHDCYEWWEFKSMPVKPLASTSNHEIILKK